MNYTHDENQIVFLKDADIISSFNEKNALDKVVLSNGIPSYELFKKTYDSLSTYDNNLSLHIKDNVEISVGNISTLLKETILSSNGISVIVNGLCTLISDAHNFLSNSLSSEIEKLSTSLSNTTSLSIELLCSEIIANDNDIFNISSYLSNDVVHYKGDVFLADSYKDPEGEAIVDPTKNLYGLLLTNALVGNNRSYSLQKGFIFRASNSSNVKYFEFKDDTGKVTLTNNSYIIIKNNVSEVLNIEISDIEIISDIAANDTFLSSNLSIAQADISRLSTELNNTSVLISLSVFGLSNEVKRISSEISNELNRTELSVFGLSNEVKRISAEISTELCVCELSVNGLSNEVDRISSELSNELCACELSVNGLSNEVKRISSEISNELCACELSVNGLSNEVKRISSEISNELNRTELSVNGLSIEIDRISSELSTALSISSDSLQRLIVSNDNDITELSNNVNFLLSVGQDSVEYKGTVAKYNPTGTLTSNYHLSAFLNSIVKDENGFIKQGFMYRLSAVQDTLSDHFNESIKLGVNDYLIVNKDTYLSSVSFKDIDIIRDASVEATRLSTELSTELYACELSVNGLSIEVDRISSELSTELSTKFKNSLLSVFGLSNEVDRISAELSNELNRTELSVFGLSNEVDRISAELSSELNRTELSVNGLSILVKNYKVGLSNSIDNLSLELNNASSYLNTEVKSLWNTVAGGVNYKGHLNIKDETIYKPNLHLSTLFGIYKNLYDDSGKLTSNFTFKNGWLYNITTNKEYDTADVPSIKLENNDYIIMHNHNAESVDVSCISRETVDIIESVLDDYVRFALLNTISTTLSSDYVNKILDLSSKLSLELCATNLSVHEISAYVDNLELSVNGLSNEVDRISSEISTELCACELSVNGLSNEVDRISIELSTALSISSDLLQRLIVSNDNDILVLSNNVNFLLSVGQDSVEYKGTVAKYNPTGTLTSNYHISAFLNGAVKDENGFIKQGFMYRLSAVQDTLSDHFNESIKLGVNDYLIINKDTYLSSVSFKDIDIIRDASVEATRLSVEFSTELKNTELSVNGLSIEVDRISIELSNELNRAELSVNGLSIEVDRISIELSNELCNTQLSVNGLSTEVDRISAELSNELNRTLLSVNGLSNEVDRISVELSTALSISSDSLQRLIVSNDNDITELSDKVEFLLSVGQDSVEYKGTVAKYNPTGTLTSNYHLSAFLNSAVKDENGFIKQGFMYRLSAVQDTLSDHLDTSIKLGVNDYLIVNKDTYLSSVSFKDIDIIRDASVEATRLSIELSNELNRAELSVNGLSIEVDRISSELSTELSTKFKNSLLSVFGLSNEVKRISTEISNELNRTELSVNGLSNEVDRISSELSNELCACELSVNGLSNEVDRISTELSNELCACELSVNGLSNEVDRISTELSNELNRTELSVFGLSNEVDRISTELSNELNRTLLSVNGLSTEVDRISIELSTTLKLSSEELQRLIVSNDNDITTLSTDLSDLSYHYHKTFTEEFYTKGTSHGEDISVDVLNVVDSEETDNKYTLQLLSGTLVLVKNK